MDNQTPTNERSSKAQTVVEFALVLPVLLLLLFGIIEFGRMLFIYVTVTSASREAARYGSAVGPTASGLPRYLDCNGMISAAEKVGILSGIGDGNIAISYDFGPTESCDPNLERNGEKVSPDCACPSGGIGPSGLQLGDRVVVDVNVDYTPLLPVDFITHGFPIHSQTARTVIREVAVSAANIPPPPPPPECIVSFVTGGWGETEGTDPGNYKTYSVGVNITGNCGPITIPLAYGGDAVQGSGPRDDYKDAPASITLLRSGSFDISINMDDIYEPNRTIQIGMGELSPFNAIKGGIQQFTLTIDDDEDLPHVYFPEFLHSVPESVGVYEATVLLDRQSSVDVVATFSANNVTTQTRDYEILTPSPITFAPYETVKTIQVHIIDDLMYEDDENLMLSLDSVSGGADPGLNPPNLYNTHTIRIMNNDDPPMVYFEFEQQYVTEETGEVLVKVLLSAASSKPVIVDLINSPDGTATLGADYTISTSSPINISAGSTSALIHLNMIRDGVDEPNEIIVLALSNPQDASLGLPKVTTISIVKTTVSFSAAFQASPENVGTMTAVVQLDYPAAGPVVVPFMVSGTAWNGHDYTIDASPVTIPLGQMSAVIRINVTEDTLYEDPETVILTMGNPIGASPGNIRMHTATIIDNDAKPIVSFTVPSQSAMENIGQPVNIGVRLNTASGKDVTVPFTLGGTAVLGADYSISNSPVFIPAGSTSANIVVTFIDDQAYEPDDTVVVTLGTPLEATLGTPNIHTLSIQNDDAPTCSVFSTDAYFDPKHSKFTWKLYNNGVDLEISRVLVTFDSNGSKLEQVQFGPLLWTGSDGSTARVEAPWFASADPSFPGKGAYKYMIFNFQYDKAVTRMIKIQVSFTNAVCPDYSRTDFTNN